MEELNKIFPYQDWKRIVSYLQRRVQFLFEQIESGKFHILKELAESDNGKQLMKDISEVRRLENGDIDLSTCSSLVKLTAKTAFFLSQEQENMAAENPATVVKDPVKAISQATKTYFELLEDFFIKATGVKAEKFEFEEYRRKATTDSTHKLSERAFKAYNIYLPKILEFHEKNSSLLLGASKEIGGLKSVLGGTTGFTDATYNSIRKFALYADTIFIPDPILPFIETERPEERFAIIKLLLACRTLLLLKPLVDINLSYPAIVVFPSWEKRLEMRDVATRDGISRLILNFFSYYLNAAFDDESELVEYISGSGKNAFVGAVNNYQLFWPPEEKTPLSVHSGIKVYKKWLKTWRASQWTKEAFDLSPELLVLNGIFERLIPQFHVRDNAQAFGAQPLFSLSPNFHYFQLTSNASSGQLGKIGVLNQSSQIILQSLLNPKIAWLGNVPIKNLAELRKDGCNEEFRQQLSLFTNELYDATYKDLDQVSNNVMRGLQSLLDKHDQEARRIEAEYLEKHLTTLGVSILTVASSFFPLLDPLFGLASLAPLGKAAGDIWNQLKDETRLSKSLIGVLSQATGMSD